ncbi:MAG: TrmJ/YjtD family RNA methyltransferase [Alphaproteobacteria bacterium]|nr:MAG: TrmJ/YjtD family RNA methyltransferase [Alphaproteobacteria bacterium]
MPGAGTDKTKAWVERPGPCVILVEPQLADNIGAAARAMANFGLSRLRLVNPRAGWPAERAWVMASGAHRILDDVVVYESVAAAIGDLNYVFAATARAHDQAKPVVDAAAAAQIASGKIAAGERVGLMFGRERNGLENDEVALADSIITLPVNPSFASLNLAQAVVIVAYEWFKLASGGKLPFEMPRKSDAAPRQQLLAFFQNLERELEKVEFFRPPDKRETMQINLRNIFSRMQPTQQDIQTLSGVIMAIAEGRKGPARGGILDNEEAGKLRALLAEHGGEQARDADAPVRGLAKFLRRNPTDAERALWDGLTKDRRFAGLFKRQTPIGPHINDFVSFQQRLVIDLVPDEEGEAAAKARAQRHAWLKEHDYRVVSIKQAELLCDLPGVLDSLAAALAGPL